MSISNSTSRRPDYWGWALALMSSVLAVCFLAFLFYFFLRPNSDWVWAALQAAFGGLAFAGLLVALRMQSDELRLQREELGATRQEVARQAEAQQILAQSSVQQGEILSRQTELLEWQAILNERQFDSKLEIKVDYIEAEPGGAKKVVMRIVNVHNPVVRIDSIQYSNQATGDDGASEPWEGLKELYYGQFDSYSFRVEKTSDPPLPVVAVESTGKVHEFPTAEIAKELSDPQSDYLRR